MHYHEGTLFTSTVLKNQSRDRVFTAEEGFNIAFAIIDSGTADFSDVAGRELHEYLLVEAILHTFDYRNGETNTSTISLNPHICTEDELGFNGSENSNFFKLANEWQQII